MFRKAALRVVVAIVMCAFATDALAAQRQERPRLAVVVVIDQLAMMQLDRYQDLFGNGGFRRLLNEGTVALDARYLGAPTVTAHGHATLATGAYGDRHGIVGNIWWERGAGKTYVCYDPGYKLLTRDTLPFDGTAPTRLLVPTFADALRMSHPGARVVSLSLKDRGAILFGGFRPEAAIWYDAISDRWTSSTYYGDHLPSWVPTTPVSGEAPAWDRLTEPRFCGLLPQALKPGSAGDCAARLYAQRAGPDEDAAEHAAFGLGPTFPHPLPAPGDAHRGKLFIATPLADEALFSLALKALDAEQLGRRGVPDLLFISASAHDYVGHDFGPESQEALDALLREDASLARLLTALDAKLGRGNYVFALAADHGVRPTPLRAEREHQNAGMMDPVALINSADHALDAAFGPRDYLTPISNTGFSYHEEALAGLDRAKADEIVIASIMKQRGIKAVYPRSLFVSQLALRGDAVFYGRSYFDGRSPDFILEPFPGWAWEDVATHEGPYLSEQRVPFIIYRAGRTPMSIDGTIDAASLTPTLAGIMGSAPPVAAEAPILTQVVEHLR